MATTTAHETSLERAWRPRYWSVLWRMGAAWWLAYLGAFLASGLAEVLAFEGEWRTQPPEPWIVAADDLWSTAVNVPIWLLWLVLAVLLTNRLLIEVGDGRSLPLRWPALITTAAALLAIAPWAAQSGDGNGSGLLLLLLAALAVRSAPWKPVPWRPAPRLLLVLAAALAVLAAAGALVYAGERPLSFGIPGTCTGNGCDLREGRTTRLSTSLTNVSREPVTVTAVALGGVADGLTPGTIREIPDEGYAQPIALPRRLGSGDELTVELAVKVAPGACAKLGGGTTIADHLRVSRADGDATRTVRLTPEALPIVRSCR